MKEILSAIKKFMQDRFSLDEDKADEKIIIDSIDRSVNFKGTNLWTLIFAILIASIGLNVNSTAVIIGAMLISPLMGPIMGIGLGIGILDFNLMKRGIKNLFIAAIFSVITSFLYFLLSPLHEAKSEILARTTPSIWDVLIAFCGGMAGIIAGTRKEKSNILAGVAIATALMPPLCTAGFGLATGRPYYFLGAIYLFFINSLFICLATFLIVRFLNFERTHFSTEKQHKRVVRFIWAIVFITIIPSIYLGVKIVQKAIFEKNAKRFIQAEFHFPKTQVIHQSYIYDPRGSTIDILLIGEELKGNTIDSLKGRMPAYNLDSNSLVIHQGIDDKTEIDLVQIKESLLNEFFSQRRGQDSIPKTRNKLDRKLPDIQEELKLIFPDVTDYIVSQTDLVSTTTGRHDTVTLFVGNSSRYLSRKEKATLENWLKKRTGADSLKLVLQYQQAAEKK